MGNAQDMRLRNLRGLRNRGPYATPAFDSADAPWFAAIEAGEHYLRTVRIARMAATGDDLWPWHRRVGVIGDVVNRMLSDFLDDDCGAMDDAYYRLTKTPAEDRQ